MILSDGVVAADGATADILADEALMKAHRLELPFGFDPRFSLARLILCGGFEARRWRSAHLNHR